MKRLARIVFLLLLCIGAYISVYAQDPAETWQQYFSELGQREDAESDAWQETYEMLSELAREKMDLNSCTREDLERLPFLSAQQVMDIMEYRDRAKRFESFVELRMIPSFSKQDADMLEQFVTIGSEKASDALPPLDSILRSARQEVVAALKIPFYDREGDKNGFLGYKYKHWLRYSFNYRQRVKLGFVASQDAGEPFFAGKNACGYDYYSLYLQLRNTGFIRNLVVGRYRLRFGMGLIMNTSFGLGKLNTLATLGASANNIIGHSSRSEANYLQGVAAAIRLNRQLTLTGFVSWRKIDATLNDSAGTVTTILKSGYHRTPSEMARRRNTEETLVGTNLSFFRNGFHAGVTAFATAFNRTLKPNTTPSFRRWYPQGKHFWNASVDYGYVSAKLNIAGETATGHCGTVATINTLSYLLTPSLSVMALQRYYPYQYYSLFSQSYADGGSVNDESGLYLGMQWAPSASACLMGYVDAAYFAWPKHQASAASHSIDALLQFSGNHRAWSYLLRMRMRRRERNDGDADRLTWRNEYRSRAMIGYATGCWQWRLQGDLSICHQQATSRGYMITQHAGYRHAWLQAFLSANYFRTDDYLSRVYSYERGLLYNFSFPMFAGQGIRYAIAARADIGHKLMVLLKLGNTNYFHNVSSSSGPEHVNGHSRMELEMQAKWRF